MNKMKRILAVLAAMVVITSLSACGNKEESDNVSGSSKTESVSDKKEIDSSSEDNKEKADTQVSVGKLDDNAVLEINMPDDKKLVYSGESFSEFKEKLETEFGIEFECVESPNPDVYYKSYKTGYIETEKGNKISINYSVVKKELIIKASGMTSIKNDAGEYEWAILDFSLGDIATTTTYNDILEMGATFTDGSVNGDNDRYTLESENFETKGVQLIASDANNYGNDKKQYIVANFTVTYSGVEE